MSELDDVADELYGGPPGVFIEHRDAAAKAARADGDRELAKQITELRKPTVSAWLMNLLVRDDPGFADQVVALGEGLRDAERSLDGPALRELSTQRRALVRSLTARARKLAQPAGQRIGDSVTQELDATLTAALADPEVAREVTSGRLTVAREWSGFGSADPSATTTTGSGPRSSGTATARTEPKTRQKSAPAGQPDSGDAPTQQRPKLTLVKPAVDPEEARRARAHERQQRLRDEADRALEAADQALADAQRKHDAAQQVRDESAALLERAERAAQDAHEEEDDLVKTLAEVRRRLAAAGKAATIADKDVSQAQANLRHDEKETTTTERELQRAERAREAAAARREGL
ncbi:hypothetical protein [Cellulomonas sp. URHE0023]|uniref:hypothetical protein n=1 Tax=Cellulomonas sp. URHE0023 TaxID=1380354 RepID=UPI00068AAE36|nr:hypothetical protein [Cellulomonas sp. URHE0023]